MNRQMCSWCHTINDVIPFAKSECVQCGHDFTKPRMACECRLCLLRREMYMSVATALRTRDYKSVFDEVWRCLAKCGGCDEIRGSEYTRVFALYDKIGMWGLLEFFILAHANVASDGKTVSPEAVATILRRRAEIAEQRRAKEDQP